MNGCAVGDLLSSGLLVLVIADQWRVTGQQQGRSSNDALTNLCTLLSMVCGD